MSPARTGADLLDVGRAAAPRTDSRSGARFDIDNIFQQPRRLVDDVPEPDDDAAELGSRTALRLMLGDRQAQGGGITPSRPVAESVRADWQPLALQNAAGLVCAGPARRHRDQDANRDRITGQGEQLSCDRHRLEVDHLRPAGNDH